MHVAKKICIEVKSSKDFLEQLWLLFCVCHSLRGSRQTSFVRFSTQPCIDGEEEDDLVLAEHDVKKSI
ncbi:hypothetical protein MTR_2g058623 [Medicago truncatula]|uniref:Uncharacterized protein n=1 Tax=Medicago truncatula TaxID=3880 RepID=A0A072V9I5_MEDTR|nr:hypothetical protein MTR_2g058623 [Medicago truncatula]